MSELSSAAEIVLNKAFCAYDEEALYTAPAKKHAGMVAAAALRAAADQGENLYDPHEGKVSVVRVEHLLAIATELEAQ